MSEFHEGEIAVQTQAGVRDEAESICHVINPFISPKAQEFIRERRLAIASTIDERGRSWASLLTGKPGFIEVIRETEITITPYLITGDPLYDNLAQNHNLGLLTIDFVKRRRLRINGIATLQPTGKIHLQTQQVFFNCPKYITKRDFESTISDRTVVKQSVGDTLNRHQQDWISQADTFFIASYHPEKGADASHRGGNPGFIRIMNPNLLIFPDYTGNNLFQTFGNLTVNPYAGLLFLDFSQRHTLQLTGTAEILWETELLTEFVDAKRLVKFALEEVIETTYANLVLQSA
jgi:predicted pyridoxine 5'-phosphate oxidase superfamily flavin-nucleotide-binding protein